jgi:hypothetical protein
MCCGCVVSDSMQLEWIMQCNSWMSDGKIQGVPLVNRFGVDGLICLLGCDLHSPLAKDPALDGAFSLLS